MRILSWEELERIDSEVYNEGYRGYEFDQESTLRMLEAMGPLHPQEQESQDMTGTTTMSTSDSRRN